MRILFITLFFLFFTLPTQAFAIVDPTAVPNNKFGIHLLFPTELEEAARLVNSNGGDWGYVIIPIQDGDHDLVKWQLFMDQAKEKHLIPIIRLASEGDYFNTKVWRRPDAADVLDFANFLSSLRWPVKNKYIVVYNEVNRADEWGGMVDPAGYADILSYAATVFKSLDQDFFVISAGMDNAAPNKPGEFMNQYDFMRQMEYLKPGTFSLVDGIASHSYPNPGFAQPPNVHTNRSVTSFRYEKALAEQFAKKRLPVFITETGWTTDTIPDQTIATYYTEVFSKIWTENDIVAVTPFLLQAGGGPFGQFTFLRSDGSKTQQYLSYQAYPKEKGNPVLSNHILAAHADINPLPIMDFRSAEEKDLTIQVSHMMKSTVKWMFKL